MSTNNKTPCAYFGKRRGFYKESGKRRGDTPYMMIIFTFALLAYKHMKRP